MEEESSKTVITVSVPGWHHGEIGDYAFDAKVCDAPAETGIDGGRVIFLYVYRKDRAKKSVAEYERGWEVYPKSKKLEALLDKILIELEKLPTNAN